tara:strand:- start:9 stop:878 length:870 start_codon:yes stop_codon:yes gene_type:complete
MLAETASNLSLFFGRFHAVVLHCPIGFIVALLLLEIYIFFKPSKELIRLTKYLLGACALSTALAAYLGILLARDGGYDTNTLELHRWTGISVGVLTITANLTHIKIFRESGKFIFRSAYKFNLVALVSIMTFAGHYGGNLTHGSQYLIEYAPETIKKFISEKSTKIPEVEDSKKTIAGNTPDEIFIRDIKPIFKNKCEKCHNGDKMKGDYRLDDLENTLIAGESEEDPIVPGYPFDSNLVRLIFLDPEDEEAMPPSGKASLTNEELVKITQWVRDPSNFVGVEIAKDDL